MNSRSQWTRRFSELASTNFTVSGVEHDLTSFWGTVPQAVCLFTPVTGFPTSACGMPPAGQQGYCQDDDSVFADITEASTAVLGGQFSPWFAHMLPHE